MGEPNNVNDSESRRSFVKKVAYVAPLVLTLKADSAFASYGSGKPEQQEVNSGVGKGVDPPRRGKPAEQKGNNGVGNGVDAQPPCNPPTNDGQGTGPGHPGNSHRGNGS